MKFLCLHGNGTNSHVMDMQTAALRHELEDNHTYEFVEAIWETPMADGLDAISNDDSKFYAFYDPNNLSTLQDAVAQLGEYIAAEGPFDAIMAFSAGAVVSAAYLMDRAARRPADRVGDIRAAVFLSSGNNTSEFQYLGFKPGKISIDIPTAHIWGSDDTVSLTGAADVVSFCKPERCLTLVHDGGHEVPKKEALTKTVHTVRRMLQIADEL